MLSPWLGILTVLTSFCGLAAGLEGYRRSRAVDSELLRKLLHMGMGLVTLALPWLFAAAWPVVVLAALFVFGMIALRAAPHLQRVLGSVVHGVSRPSLGEIYFPLAVGLLFVLSGGDPLTFCIPMLLLTFADALAALIGARYGVLRFSTGHGEKSVVGSIAFLAAALPSIQVPLVLFSDTDRAEALLIAATVALQATLLEAVALRGLDNLLVPLGGFLCLKSLLELNVAALATHLGIAVFLVTLFLLTVSYRSAAHHREAPVHRGRFPRKRTGDTQEGPSHDVV
jgi:phytol kinase